MKQDFVIQMSDFQELRLIEVAREGILRGFLKKESKPAAKCHQVSQGTDYRFKMWL